MVQRAPMADGLITPPEIVGKLDRVVGADLRRVHAAAVPSEVLHVQHVAADHRPLHRDGLPILLAPFVQRRRNGRAQRPADIPDL